MVKFVAPDVNMKVKVIFIQASLVAVLSQRADRPL